MHLKELEKRLDAFFYRPEFVQLERKVSRISDTKLADYIESISGGATPNKTTEKECYCEEGEGLPFLRVQNVTSEGVDLANCKFITARTHNVMLKRSQVKQGDLITKITGVGRMAISSVAPEGFEGNINQHLVVMKTKNRRTSEILAAYLNSDIGEKLAFRRTTGGTRPALDYEALKSVPVVFRPEIVEIMEKAYKIKHLKENQSQNAFDSISKFVIDSLKFVLPTATDKMSYVVNSKRIQNNRFDARFYGLFFMEFERILNKRSDVKTIGDITTYIGSGATPLAGSDAYTDKEQGVPFIRIGNMSKGKVTLDDVLYIKRKIHDTMLKRTQLKPNDVLLSIAGTIGISSVVHYGIGEANINQAIARIVLKDDIDPYYVSAILNSPIGRIQSTRIARPSVQANLNLDEVGTIKIPIPDKNTMKEIADEVRLRMEEAEQLKSEAELVVSQAKKRVETIILAK